MYEDKENGFGETAENENGSEGIHETDNEMDGTVEDCVNADSSEGGDAGMNAGTTQDGANESGSTYRYDRSYYQQNRDENNSYRYEENGTAQTDSQYRDYRQAYGQESTQSSFRGQEGTGAYQDAYQSNPGYGSGNQFYGNANEDEKRNRKARRQERKQARRQNRKSRGRSKTASRVAAVAAGLVAVAAVSMGTTYASLQLFGNKEPMVIQSESAKEPNATRISTTTTGKTLVTTDVSSVVSEVMPSVVSISNVGTETIQSFFGQSGTYEYTSSGSGIIVGQSADELLIVTNHHVISGADTIKVTFVDGKEYVADVKGSDSTIDIAVIAISIDDVSEDTLDQIKVATLGDSDALSVGEPAIAIGNAMGYGQSVTTGCISALNRKVTVENVTNTLIQTDAAINPGNSGGALLNLAGEVIGINSVKYASTEVEGMGYAIPISDVMDVINDLMNNETKKKVDASEAGVLGIRALDINSSVSQTYSMPQGVFVSSVEKGGAADKAGIKKGDIITKLAGTIVTSSSDLTTELEYHAAGTDVEVVVQSPVENGYGYEEKTFQVTLDKKSK